MTPAEFEQHVREHRVESLFEIDDAGHVLLGNPQWIETTHGRYLQVTLLHARVIDVH